MFIQYLYMFILYIISIYTMFVHYLIYSVLYSEERDAQRIPKVIP